VLLLDEFLPRYDVRASYSTRVAAPPSRVYASLRTANLDHWGLMRTLVLLRRVPELVARPGVWPTLRIRRTGKVTLEDLLSSGFGVLGERLGEELVLGTVGRFWTARGERRAPDPDGFRRFDEPGSAKAAMSFVLAPEPNGKTQLTTETRVRCADTEARRRFRRYWALVGPFSGLIRREMLAAMRTAAEQG
jgi:hypothetical protein